MKKFKIIRNAERQALNIFKGIAIPHLVEVPDSRVMDGVDYVYGVSDRKCYVATEKVLKFNRKALRNIGKRKEEKVDPRYNGGDDTMILKVGQPGSRERVEALRTQYEAITAHGEEVSPFGWEG